MMHLEERAAPPVAVTPEGVYALAPSPDFAGDGICFAACASGLYLSTNFGKSWASAYESLHLDTEVATTAVAVSPEYASDRRVFAGVPGGVLRSADGGRSWYSATLPAPPPIISSLAISPAFAADGTLFAATLEDGVFRSTDRGSRWTPGNFGLIDLHVLCLAVSPSFAEDETVFAGTESGMFCSTNGGRGWHDVDLSPDLAPIQCLALSPGYQQDGILFAGTETRGLLYSSDRGATWTRVGGDILPEGITSVLLAPSFSTQPDMLVLADSMLFISRDGGQTWSRSWDELAPGADATCLAAPYGLGPEARLLIGLADGGVLLISGHSAGSLFD